ncbi:hypothetical protein [Mycobacterium sp. DBP42]|uniref:hypothetical protein n=1 Tax=Mycobacterium sp. DBP42 TaxID=2545267 RepID=UPI00110CEBE7|nr:hypothetical protein [Mycobacterium sp. DBP42]TMS50973.1 hypothetical protein E0T84_21535 [Mycobacterium sp. DBP42]
MLWPDRVDLWVATIGIDDMGNDTLIWTDSQEYPAAVSPVDAEQTIVSAVGGSSVVTRYRVLLAPQAVLPWPVPELGIRIGWGPYVATEDDSTGLALDGGVERHILRRRLHHYEFVTKVVVG